MRKSTGYGVIVLLVLIAAEGFSYLALRVDNSPIQKRLYWPPVVSPEEFASHLEHRDDLLGWPRRDWLAENADAMGARRSPANERLRDQPVCVSTYGDSFTYGSEVADELSWGNLLADDLGCRVSNFGVPGYGVDQSILRFERNTDDRADLVILGFYILDMDRNLNQWFSLLSEAHTMTLAFKPRLRMDEQDQLHLEAIRVNTYGTLQRVIERPAEVLTAEAYLPDGPAMHSKVAASFPYAWTVARLARKVFTEVDWSQVSPSRSIRQWNYPLWFDSRDGPSPEKVRLNALLMRRFARSCAAREQRCVVLVIPDADEIEEVEEIQSHGVDRRSRVEQVRRSIAQEIEMWDPTGYFVEHSKDRGICYFFGPDRACHGHYNADGYALLARFVAEKIRGGL